MRKHENHPKSFEQTASSLLQTYRSLVTAAGGTSSSPHKETNFSYSSILPEAPLHPLSPGVAFQDFAQPEKEEVAIIKNNSSAFIGTGLEDKYDDKDG
ncbi:hypothetical protein BJ878DRAFT_545878 [Calycina marina]|uniref:Uncharacterized protein n=1 Tax=Calycina marina TaxID=1763456 RepID=A0A9P8CBD5_9HELO|nr:hypothetical protein BJ878DRAFT_545878 [Calycina marina]